MAYSKVPTAWLTGYAYSAPNQSVPLSTFPEITAAEAHTTTGDIANILFGWLHALHVKWTATATADRPTKWLIAKSESTNTDTGKITTSFTLQFTTSIAAGGQNVDAEA